MSHYLARIACNLYVDSFSDDISLFRKHKRILGAKFIKGEKNCNILTKNRNIYIYIYIYIYIREQCIFGELGNINFI